MTSQDFYSVRDLCRRYNVKAASTIWRWVAAGKFPKPIKLTDKTTRWRGDAIERYEAERERAA